MMQTLVSITPGAPRVDADTATLIDDAATLLAKRRGDQLVDTEDVLTRIHLLASLRDQITADLDDTINDAINDERPIADIAIVAGADPDTLNEHHNRDRDDTRKPAHT